MAESLKQMAAAPRPALLRRVLSFREPLLLIPHLLVFLGAAASAFFGSYSSFLQSFARSSLFPSSAAAKCACACAYASSSPAAAAGSPCHHHFGAENVVDGAEEVEEEDAALSREEVEAIMARIGVAATAGRGGEGLAAVMGRDEASRLFDAEEPSFAEVRSAFAVLDADRDGFIGAADLQGALARLGVRDVVDAAACRAMVTAAGGGRDGRMSLFQFVTFLETGLR